MTVTQIRVALSLSLLLSEGLQREKKAIAHHRKFQSRKVFKGKWWYGTDLARVRENYSRKFVLSIFLLIADISKSRRESFLQLFEGIKIYELFLLFQRLTEKNTYTHTDTNKNKFWTFIISSSFTYSKRTILQDFVLELVRALNVNNYLWFFSVSRHNSREKYGLEVSETKYNINHSV